VGIKGTAPMTAERRIFINLSELIGAEYECTHCRTRCSVSFAQFEKVPELCPNCGKRWFSETPLSSGELSDLITINEFFASLDKMKRRKFQAIVRLEAAPFVQVESQKGV
jgi:tRNA G26 N,N-dimethylase Trm1